MGQRFVDIGGYYNRGFTVMAHNWVGPITVHI